MEIVSNPTNTEYFIGDELDTAGLTVKVTFNNGTSTTLSSGFDVVGYNSANAGTQTLTVKYTVGSTTVEATFDVTVKEIPATTGFMYRIGNINNVSTDQLAAMLNGGGVQTFSMRAAATPDVKITPYTGNANYDGSKFTGTGIVKITVDGTAHYVQVVNAYNMTKLEDRHAASGVDWVLVQDIEFTGPDTVQMYGNTLYGNGFVLDLTNYEPQEIELDNVFIIKMNSATIDNARIIGKTYTDGAYIYKSDASANKENYMSLLFATGESNILNSYVYGTRAPVRVEGDVLIENTTLAGGNVANLDMKGGELTLNNVTTINQSSDVVGYGIFMDNDAGMDEDGNIRPITINVNGLNSYNWLSTDDAANMNDTTGNDYMSSILDNILTNETFQNAESVNLSIICLNDNANVVVNGMGDPLTAEISGTTGRVWGETGELKDAPEYESENCEPVPPEFTWSEYSASTEFVKGGYVDYNADLLAAEKFGEKLTVTVTCNGGTVTDKTIRFSAKGIYTITYTVVDHHNYRYNDNDELEAYDITYTFTIDVNVIELEPQTKHAEFKIAGSETTIVEKDGKKYIVAVNNSSSYTWQTMEFGFKYPELATLMSDGINGQHSSGYKACYPIFQAVEIIDYADGGTGAAITYNSATTTLPANLKYVKDRDGTGLKYQGSSNGDTTKGTVYQSLLCFTSPNTTKSRNEHFTWIEYSYTDNAGETYYYVVGYRAQAQTYKSCVAADTLVMLADGTQKRIDQVTYDDQLLVWNFFTGDYDVVPAAIIYYHGDDDYRILTLNFEDGTSVRVINNHGFFDMEKNAFIFIDDVHVINAGLVVLATIVNFLNNHIAEVVAECVEAVFCIIGIGDVHQFSLMGSNQVGNHCIVCFIQSISHGIKVLDGVCIKYLLVDVLSGQDTADGFTRIAQRFQFTNNLIHGLDLDGSAFADFVCRYAVEESRYFIFNSVGDFFILLNSSNLSDSLSLMASLA